VIGLLLPSAAAVVLVCVLRRAYPAFGRIQFHWWGLAAVAFAIELVLYNPPVDSLPLAIALGPWLWVATRFALLASILRNAHPRAAGFVPCLLVALGIGLNTVVVVANGGYMPQSQQTASAVWGVAPASAEPPQTRLENTRPMDSQSRLTWLGDVVPEPTWLPRPNVLSIGDVVLAVGMAGWIFAQLWSVGTAGKCCQAGATGNVEFDEDVFDMGLDRLDGNHQRFRNRSI